MFAIQRTYKDTTIKLFVGVFTHTELANRVVEHCQSIGIYNLKIISISLEEYSKYMESRGVK